MWTALVGTPQACGKTMVRQDSPTTRPEDRGKARIAMRSMASNKTRLLARLLIALALTGLVASLAGPAIALTEDELKARIEAATKGFSDISVTMTVTLKDKKALEKMEPSYARLYECKTANVFVKQPDKVRTEGKLGMVKFEYIINGTMKIFRAKNLRINQKEDCAKKPAKLQSAFDFGLLTPTVWRDRTMKIIPDPEADAKGEIKVRLQWPTGNTGHVIWLDAKDLWLKKVEKHDGSDKVESTIVYTNPTKFGTIMVPTKAELFSPEGVSVGTSEETNIKVNTNLADTLFN